MRDAGCGMRDAGCRMQDAGCGMRDAGCRMQDAGCRMRDAGLFYPLSEKCRQPLPINLRHLTLKGQSTVFPSN
ncbi:hypothetical protein DVV14_09580 [Vibrio coralliilyticus]|nr:hypothetical protein DVV14_09580 [Vibrio coralliilyticus]